MVALRFALVALLAALLVVGCGGTPQVTTTDQAFSTIEAGLATIQAPTTAPPTTVSVTAAPRPATKPSTGLGLPRDFIQSHFETAPYSITFKDAPATNGEATVEGTSDVKGVKIVLLGPPENVREAQVQATVGSQGASSEDALRHMIALLEVAAPGISNPTLWLQPHLDKALDEKTDVAIEGNRMITIIAAQETGLIILSVQRAP